MTLKTIALRQFVPIGSSHSLSPIHSFVSLFTKYINLLQCLCALIETWMTSFQLKKCLMGTLDNSRSVVRYFSVSIAS